MKTTEYTESGAAHAINGTSDKLDASSTQDTKDIYVT
jgi:hypothetical protein